MSRLVAYGMPEKVWVDGSGWHRQAQLPDGTVINQHGMEALANAQHNEHATKWQKEHPELVEKFKNRNNSIFYNIGKWLNPNTEKTSVGKFFDNIGLISPVAEGAALGLTGAGLGALAGYGSDALLGTNIGSLVPALIAGGLGGFAGYKRGNKTNDEFNNIMKAHEIGRQPSANMANQMKKESAMYKNPRNFILEKLSAAKGISMTDRVKLAIAIQNLSDVEAEELKALVREETNFENIPGTITAFFNEESEQALPEADQAFQLGALLTMAASETKLPSKQASVLTKEDKLNLIKTLGVAYSTCGMHKQAAVHKDIVSGAILDEDVLDGAAFEAAQLLGNSIMTKKAGFLDTVSNALGTGKDLLMLSMILGGAGLGGLAWKIKRDSSVGSTEAEAKLQQAKYYKELANDMNKSLRAKAIREAKTEADKNNQVLPSDASIKEVVNDVAEPNYIL